jgi:hypothetical protein
MRKHIAVAAGAVATTFAVAVAVAAGTLVHDPKVQVSVGGRHSGNAAFLSLVGISADEDLPRALSELKVADTDLILQGKIIALRPGPTRGQISFKDGVSTPLWMFAVATLMTDDGVTREVLIPLADRFATREELAASLPPGEVVLIAHRITDAARAEYTGTTPDWDATRPWDVLVDDGGEVPTAAGAGAAATFLTPGTLEEVAEELSQEMDVPTQ